MSGKISATPSQRNEYIKRSFRKLGSAKQQMLTLGLTDASDGMYAGSKPVFVPIVCSLLRSLWPTLVEYI